MNRVSFSFSRMSRGGADGLAPAPLSTSVLARASWRLDRFIGVNAGWAGGEVVSPAADGKRVPNVGRRGQQACRFAPSGVSCLTGGYNSSAGSLDSTGEPA